jgi:hypothetical protein
MRDGKEGFPFASQNVLGRKVSTIAKPRATAAKYQSSIGTLAPEPFSLKETAQPGRTSTNGQSKLIGQAR